MRRALAIAFACLAFPAAATASTAEVVVVHGRGDYASLVYTAGDGEANDVTLTGDLHSVTLEDPGADITAGPGCSPNGVHSVTCTSELEMSIGVRLGDEDDKATSEGLPFTAYGGDGDDTMEGDDGVSLYGDQGADTLTGAGNLIGGPGSDTLTGSDYGDYIEGGPGSDTIDGRGNPEAGTYGDTVSYRDHARGVTVDLSAPGSPAGAEGEGDTITNVENVDGTYHRDVLTAPQTVPGPDSGSRLRGLAGDDVLRGGPGPDDLDGDRGSDRIAGGAGEDTIFGGAGVDDLRGDGGFDVIYGGEGTARGSRRDVVNCGDAGGEVIGMQATYRMADVIDQSCHQFNFQVPIGTLSLEYDGEPTRTVSSTIPATRHCVFTVGLRLRGRTLGSATREIRRGHRATLNIALPDDVRAELASRGAIRLGYSLTMRCGQRLRHPAATGWPLVLHAPAR